MGCVILGCGKAAPQLAVTNTCLEQLVDTSDEWIRTRTGIESRGIAVTETAADLGEAAARRALGWEEGGWCEQPVAAEDIDLLICATVSPDALLPSEGALIRRRLGLNNAVTFDLNAACSGFVYSAAIVEAMMAASALTAETSSTGACPRGRAKTGRHAVRKALVIGTERLSRITNWNDRNTCVLFGDGAGAAVFEWDDSRPGIISSYMVNTDDDANSLTCPLSYDVNFPFDENGVVGGSAMACVEGDAGESVETTERNFLTGSDSSTNPIDPTLTALDAELGAAESIGAGNPRQAVRMNGQAVFKFAAEAMVDSITHALEAADLTLSDISLIVPHQANERIIAYAAKKLDVPMSIFQLSIAENGNTSAASVPIALTDAYVEGRIHRGDKVLVVAFGGGLTAGSFIYEA